MALLPTFTNAADEKAAFKDSREKASYAVGVLVGNNSNRSIKQSHMDLDIDVMLASIKDVLQGKESKMTDQEARMVVAEYGKEMMRKIAEPNHKEGEAFFATNKLAQGVKVQSASLPGLTNEFQYKVLAEGSGESPKLGETVSVNIKGKLLNGTPFDVSRPGVPFKFTLGRNNGAPGWTEAALLMKPGSKLEVFLPSALAFGDNGYGATVPPGATVIFEIELLTVDPAKAVGQGPSAPLTSDIIKVPGADEIKKGAKIEVMKPEDVEKMIKAGTNAPAK
jgi:FKBP-type peptidyl-prolyl cis-trans isomerase